MFGADCAVAIVSQSVGDSVPATTPNTIASVKAPLPMDAGRRGHQRKVTGSDNGGRPELWRECEVIPNPGRQRGWVAA